MGTELQVYRQGLGSVDADGLNTFQQTCDNRAQLRAFVGITGVQVFMRGYVTPADGGQGDFYWDATSTAVDDGGVTTLAPNGYGLLAGRWLRIPNSTANTQTITGAEVQIAAAGTVDLGAAAQHAILIVGSGQAVTSFGASASLSSPYYFVRWAGSNTLTYDPVALILPGAANITTAANDWMVVEYLGSGNWVVVEYQRASGLILSAGVANNAQTQAGASSGLAVSPAGLASVVQTQAMTFGVDTGTANNLAISPSPSVTGLSAGMRFQVKVAHTTTSSTVKLQVSSLVPQNVTVDGSAPAVGVLVAGQVYDFLWDGSVFQIMGTGCAANSLAANGYTQFIGGLLLQWGTASAVPSGGSGTFYNFPIAFKSVCYAVVTGIVVTGTNASVSVVSFSPSGVTLRNNQASSSDTYFIAIGQ